MSRLDSPDKTLWLPPSPLQLAPRCEVACDFAVAWSRGATDADGQVELGVHAVERGRLFLEVRQLEENLCGADVRFVVGD